MLNPAFQLPGENILFKFHFIFMLHLNVFRGWIEYKKRRMKLGFMIPTGTVKKIEKRKGIRGKREIKESMTI